MDTIQDILSRDDNIENNPLRCVVCKNFLSIPPILHNDSLGSICGRENCNKFATSRGTHYRQSAYEALARFLQFPCMYRENGCKERLQWGEIGEHEKICQFVDLLCPFSTNRFEQLEVEGCNWRGSTSTLIDHLEERHSEHKFEGNIHFDLKYDLKDNKLFFARIQESIVIVLVDFAQEPYAYCKVWSGPEIWRNIKYKIEITTEETKLLTASKFQKAELIHPTIFKTGINNSWLKIDTDYIKNFFDSPDVLTIKFYFNDFVMGISEHVHCNSTTTLLDDVKCDGCHQELCKSIFVCRSGSHTLCEKCIQKNEGKNSSQQFTFGSSNQKAPNSIFQTNYNFPKTEENSCSLCVAPQNKNIDRNYALEKLKSVNYQSFKHCLLCMKKVDCLSSHLYGKHNELIHQLDESYDDFSSNHYVFSFDDHIFLLSKNISCNDDLSFWVQCLETREIKYKYELKLMNSKKSYCAITFSDFCHPEYTKNVVPGYHTVVPYNFLKTILPYVKSIDFKLRISKI